MIPPADAVSSYDQDTFAFLTGGGEMGRLIRIRDWSDTSLGPVNTWPASLRTTLSMVLTARFPMGLWWGEDLVQFYNDAYRPFLGNQGKHPEALGQRGPECWAEVWHLLEPLVGQVLSGGEATWQENQLIPIYRNGRIEEACWTYSYSPVRDEAGKIAGILVLCQETTSQVETFRLAEQRFENFVRQATVGIIVLRGEEMVVDVVNDAYGRLIDRTSEELLNQPLFSVIPEAKPYFYPILEKVLTSGEPLYLYDYPYFVLVDGGRKEGFLDLVYQPFREIDGSISGVMVLCHNVSEKVLARKKLEESEQLFRTFANNIQNLAWMATGEGWIYWYNQQWYDYTGTSLAEMQGWGWEKVHHPDHIERVVAFVKEAWRKEKTWELTFPLKRADGVYRWFLTRAYAVKDAEGKVIRWIGTNTDIDDQKRAQEALTTSEREAQTLAEELAAVNEELRSANEEIQASNEELSLANGQLIRINQDLNRVNIDLDNFVYAASHDLKAPITNIEGLVKILLQNLSPESRQLPKVEQSIALIADSVARFKRTIANLTDIVKLQQENQGEASEVTLKDLIAEVLLDLEPMIESSGARITVKAEACLTLRFSEKNLRSIVYNLLSNAIKYRSPDRAPQVQIGCKTEAGYQVFSVGDNGLGMEENRLGQLFTMFKRFHDHVEGSGIGLYMVKKMVENAGGKIEVESRLGEGSTFRIYFLP